MNLNAELDILPQGFQNDRSAEPELAALSACYDFITGLGNRRLFEHLIEEKIESSNNLHHDFGLLLFKLGNLDFIDKSFGFRTGDRITYEISRIFLKFADSENSVFRVAQDAFCLLLPDCRRNEIVFRANKIINCVIKMDFSENGKKFKVQINGGGLFFKPETPKPTDYLSLAFKACDIAEEFGQNRFYLADMQDVLLIKKHYEMKHLIDIYDAVQRGKIVLYSQKIQRISPAAEHYREHFEILCRMYNQEGNIVMPGDFIPQLEKQGSIVMLDGWVLKQSLKLIENRRRNFDSTENCMYNVNLSVKTISDESFVSRCRYLLKKYRHIAPFLCFEITETMAVSNFNATRDFIKVIHDYGAKFAIDDFGSGGASLECLKELSVDFVKIDGAFVADIVENPISQIIVESVCKLADLLKICVVAEKVETHETETALVRFGVHYIQGYKIERPQPFSP